MKNKVKVKQRRLLMKRVFCDSMQLQFKTDKRNVTGINDNMVQLQLAKINFVNEWRRGKERVSGRGLYITVQEYKKLSFGIPKRKYNDRTRFELERGRI